MNPFGILNQLIDSFCDKNAFVLNLLQDQLFYIIPTKLNILKSKRYFVFPELCSIREKGLDCQMPPEFVISVKSKDDEYMVGVTCEKHKEAFTKKLEILQKDGKVPKGTINFTGLKPVGTNCIRIDPNYLIEL